VMGPFWERWRNPSPGNDVDEQPFLAVSTTDEMVHARVRARELDGKSPKGNNGLRVERGGVTSVEWTLRRR